MNSPSAQPASDAAPEAATERAARRLRTLQALAEAGLKAAEALQMQIEAAATAPAEDPAVAARTAADLARAFAQVSRAVSVAVALEDKLDQDPETRRLEARARAARSSEPELARRRAKVAGAVEAVIVAKEGALSSIRGGELKKALDRLLDLEVQDGDDFLARPAGELVARICRDLGLKPDWTRWDHDWAVEAEAADLAPRVRPPARSTHPPGPRAASPRPAHPAANRTAEMMETGGGP